MKREVGTMCNVRCRHCKEPGIACMEKEISKLEKEGVKKDISTLILLPQTVSISITDLKKK